MTSKPYEGTTHLKRQPFEERLNENFWRNKH